MKVLVTGANRGIGLEFVRQLVEQGAEVVATARDPEAASALTELAAANPKQVTVRALDVTQPESVASLAADFADATLDVLLNNAGYMGPHVPLGSLDYADMARTFDINAMGPLRVVEAVLPALARGTNARVVNLSSKMGSIGDNASGGAYAYRMSKAAINAASKSLAIDLAPRGVTVVAVHPGWVKTAMGGPNALTDTPDSVSALLARISALTPSDAGKFLEWSGGEIPW